MARERMDHLVGRELFLRALTGGGAPGPVVVQLARAMRDHDFAPGDVIYRAGDRNVELRFVVSGSVELRAEGEDPWPFTAPAVIGAIDVAQGRPHARTAVAMSDVHVLALTDADWYEALEDHFEFAWQVMGRNTGAAREHQLALAPTGGFADPLTDTAVGTMERRLDLVDRTLALRAIRGFSRAPLAPLALLARGAEEIALAPGDRLATEGEPARSFFAVAGGVIRAERREPAITARFGRGSIVGGTAAVGFAEHVYGAVAETAATVLAISHEHFLDVLEDHIDLFRAVLAACSAENEASLVLRAAQRRAG